VSHGTHIGRSQRALDYNAQHFGEPRGMPSDQFFAEWSALRMRILATPAGPEQDQMIEQLGFMQDTFYRTAD
jgi:hypothetical protein